MKKKIFRGLLITGLIVAAVFTVSLSTVNAKSVYDDIQATEYSMTVDETKTYTLEEMFNYAIQDEYLAQAEYNAIISEFGEVRPFINIVAAEQTHIDMLLPLFEAYGIAVPANEAASDVVVPESISSAISTGIEAEQANIAMYQAFLAQDNLPDDVRSVFTYLVSASESHLNAFSQDRYSYYGSDMMNQIRNQFQKSFQGSNDSAKQNQFKYQGSNGKMNQNSQDSKGYNGICPNA